MTHLLTWQLDCGLWGFPGVPPPSVPVKQVTVDERFLLPARRRNQYSRSLFSWSTITNKEDLKNKQHAYTKTFAHGCSLFATGWPASKNMHGGTNRDHKITLFLFFWRGAHIILLFYFQNLKWDTGWTLLSQNNPLLFMFSISFCSKGLLKTFSSWLMITKEWKLKLQQCKLWCIMLAFYELLYLCAPSAKFHKQY